MIQVFGDGKDKYFLDYQNSDTGFFIFLSREILELKMILMTCIKY